MAEALEKRRSGRLRGDEPSFTEELSVLNKPKVPSTTDTPPIKEININQNIETTTPTEQLSEQDLNIDTKQQKTNNISSNKMATLLQNIKDTGTILDTPVKPSPWKKQLQTQLTVKLMEPKGTMKDDELASLPTTTGSINNLSNDSAVSETESDHHFPTFKHVKKLINNAIQTTVTNIERFFTNTKTHVDQLEQKVEHDHHQLQELVVEQNRKLNEKIDNQYSLIAGLIENHYKFSQKINHMVIRLDKAATEIQKVKSVIPKPDYHHFNQICDTLEELRDNMNCIKSERLTEYAFDTANALRGDVSSTKQKVTDIIGTIKILQNNINASTSRINDLTTIVNELHPIKSNEIITTLQQKMENATSLLTSVESEITVLAAKVYDNTDTYLLDTQMSKFEKNIEEKLEIIKTKLQLIEKK